MSSDFESFAQKVSNAVGSKELDFGLGRKLASP
jgi:hypothetical protein